jgi:hypothetical protein
MESVLGVLANIEACPNGLKDGRTALEFKAFPKN